MNKLMKLIFKRRKKSWYLLISVMILAYFLIAVLRIAFACFDRTEEADREKQYGNWHVAVIDADTDTVNGLKNHATVEKFGISYTYGMVLDKENKDLGKIGFPRKRGRLPLSAHPSRPEISRLDWGMLYIFQSE